MTIASAIDYLNDKLAGSDQPAEQTIEASIMRLADTIGDGGSEGGSGGGGGLVVTCVYSYGGSIVTNLSHSYAEIKAACSAHEPIQLVGMDGASHGMAFWYHLNDFVFDGYDYELDEEIVGYFRFVRDVFTYTPPKTIMGNSVPGYVTVSHHQIDIKSDGTATYSRFNNDLALKS